MGARRRCGFSDIGRVPHDVELQPGSVITLHGGGGIVEVWQSLKSSGCFWYAITMDDLVWDLRGVGGRQ